MLSSLYGKIVEKLPTVGKVVFAALAIVGCKYCIGRYGLAGFLVRVIFSP
jgi:hypothetical protein